MKSALLICILILPWCLGLVAAQTPGPPSFFPHHKGDIWVYYYPNPWVPPTYEQNIIALDSLGSDGRYYIKTTRFDNFILDTANSVVYQTVAGFDTLAYFQSQFKLDAGSGDYWLLHAPDTVGDEIRKKSAKVVGVYWSYLFGDELALIKQIDYFGVTMRPEVTDSLLIDTYYLASGLGIVGYDVDTFPVLRIRGTLIDGELHGIVTSFDGDAGPRLLTRTELRQNFPNPFNPSILITYELRHRTFVELKVHDLLGRKVKQLVGEYQQIGSHSVLFNADGLASGMYIYTLKTSEGVENRKTIYLK